MPDLAIVQQGQSQVATLDSMALGYETILRRKHMVSDVMEHIMKQDVHFGTIPGCGPKPTLLKPGAEAISSTFQLSPRYTITKSELANGHREYEIVCDLYALNGGFAGSGVGSATTMEGKYRFRKADQKCPECGKEGSIIKGKQEYGGGWVCFAKKSGCGAKFKDGDPRIENQNMGRVEHDNPADYYNTVLKMAKKRAFVDAILTTTGASDIFTQDIEDMPEVIPGAGATPSSAQPAAPSSKPQVASGPSANDKMGDLPFDGGTPATGKKTTPEQVNAITNLAKKKGIIADDLFMSLSKDNSFGRKVLRASDLTGEEAGALIGWLNGTELDYLSKKGN
jgi:hypothetical protein